MRWVMGVVVLVLAGATVSTEAQAAEVGGSALIKIKAAHLFDETHAWHKGFERFRDILQSKSGGAIEVQIFSRGMLGSSKDNIYQLMQGLLDVATVSVSTASAGGIAKEMSFLETMFLWKDREHWTRALDGEVGRKIADAIERGTAKAGNPGLKVLGYWGGSQRHIFSKNQGYTLIADLTGFRIRVQDSPIQIEMWRLLGTVPSVIPYQETYKAIQTGVVDGLENELASAYSMKFHEVAPYVTETGHIMTVRPFLMSGHTWKKLSVRQQRLVLEAARDATAVARSIEWKQNDEAVAQMKAAGAKFYPFEERRQMLEKTRAIRQKEATELGVADLLEAIEIEGKAAPKEKALKK